MRRKTKVIAIIAVIAILSMTTAAFALAASQPTVSGPATAAAGAEVTFTITVNNDALMGSVSASPNLRFEGASFGAMPNIADEDGFFVFGVPTVTYRYTVAANAQHGDTFSFNVTGISASDAEGNETTWANTGASGTVAATQTQSPPPETTAPPTTEPPPGTPGGPGRDDVPKVGDAPASALPAALIGLAIIGALGVVGYIKLR